MPTLLSFYSMEKIDKYAGKYTGLILFQTRKRIQKNFDSLPKSYRGKGLRPVTQSNLFY